MPRIRHYHTTWQASPPPTPSARSWAETCHKMGFFWAADAFGVQALLAVCALPPQECMGILRGVSDPPPNTEGGSDSPLPQN